MKLFLLFLLSSYLPAISAQSVEPPYFQEYEDLLGEDFMKLCKKRGDVPPNDGDRCRRKSKACMWGTQTCGEDGNIQPTTRCNCFDRTWMCQEFQCPTMMSPTCPDLEPLEGDVCRTDLACGYDEQTCCGKTFPMYYCFCQTGTTFQCQEVDICSSATCDTVEEDLEVTLARLAREFKPFVPEVEIDLCTLPSVMGPCEAAMPRWYYDGADSKTCKEFVYGGCQGNENNFLTKAECENRCCDDAQCRTREPDTCELLADPGGCGFAFDRWAYNSQTGICETFVWSGCGGNANNFARFEDCKLECCKQQDACAEPEVCSLPPQDAGSCQGGIEIRWSYNDQTKTCNPFEYGGCEGNANNFLNLLACENRCCGGEDCSVCSLPQDVGPCDGALPRYFFNTVTSKCELFTYGGCGGNGNNFETAVECETGCCGGRSCVDVCKLPQDVGPCDGVEPRWHYNELTATCDQFDYGGCLGNGNNFETIAECERGCCENGQCGVCNLPQVVGPCEAAIQRWFFNSETEQCEQFTYGGCGSNGNNFETRTACENRCCEGGTCVCMLPQVVGPCEALIPRWFFNSESGKCEEFTYGGCGGNGNNFASSADCENRCCEDGTCDICALPQEVGPCDGVVPRWFHNSTTGQCEQFTYGGCGGNGNNFETIDECERGCCEGGTCDVCALPQEVGPCEAAIGRWFFSSESGQCERFTYGGCGGNGNNFATLSDCENRCCEDGKCDVCVLPQVVGPCDAVIPRWFFNSESGQCDRFTYGGCGGNGNNFATSAGCGSECCEGGTCDVCELPQVVGPCDAAIPRWFHNATSAKCEPFTYGGCGGNINNFESSTECESSCVNVCPLPVEVGPCDGAFPRWFYNNETQACEQFFYGGCEGNGNRFETAADCASRCCEDGLCDVCALPADVGPCDAALPLWFFNSASGQCEKFTWGGCFGNGNKFRTSAECGSSCCEGDTCDVCSLPQDIGPCDAAIPRLFFNKESGQCEPFSYGGCAGNGNNFQSSDECESECCTTPLCGAGATIVEDSLTDGGR